MLRKLLIVVIVCSMVSFAFAGGIALSGVGTRAKAMGGAMRGLADDASAMYWNPAGISLINETYVTAGIHYVDYNGEYEDFENVDLLNLIPSAVFVKNCEDKPWNFGFGIYVPFGLSTEWNLYEQPEAYGWTEMIEENEVYGSLMVLDFHPTFSYKFSDKFSAGIGISLDYSTIELTKVKFMDEMEMVPLFFQMEGTGYAFGANFGMLYKPTEELSLGVSGRLESDLNYEGSAEIDLHYSTAVATANPAVPTAMVVSTEPDAEATIVLPADLGFGLGYKLSENWLVSADFTYTWWESVDVINIEFEDGAMLGTNPLPDEEMALKWENTLRFGVGTEYLINQWALRTGYYYDESPLNDETMTVIFPDFSTKHALNLGCGYEITKNLCLDFALEYIMFEEREITEDTGENMLGTYNAKLMDIMLDLTWKF